MQTRINGLVLLVLLLLVAVPGLIFTPLLIAFGPITWARRALLALDLFGNATLFQGSPYETISSHTGRACMAGSWWGRALSAFLDLFQRGHAQGAMLQEQPLQQAIAPFVQ